MSILSPIEMWASHLKVCQECASGDTCRIGEVYFRLLMTKMAGDFSMPFSGVGKPSATG